jgi:hypothetical protein
MTARSHGGLSTPTPPSEATTLRVQTTWDGPVLSIRDRPAYEVASRFRSCRTPKTSTNRLLHSRRTGREIVAAAPVLRRPGAEVATGAGGDNEAAANSWKRL